MNNDSVQRAVALAGVTLPTNVEFEIVGDEPIVASPHYLATGAAVARLLTGVGANELWRCRTGSSQRLSVNAHHAAAALISFLHLQFLEPERRPPTDLRDGVNVTLTKIFATKDHRYIQLHGSFHDTAAVFSELGISSDAAPEAIADAVHERDSFELEAALIRLGVCGGVVLSKDEWAAHPQGSLLSDLPIVRISRIGDAPIEPLPPGDRPASGVRVVDLTRVLAGPTCAKTFAEHGADVLHVTSPRSRPIPMFDVDTGTGKRQVSLDPTLDTDRATLRRLIRDCDVFSQGYRQGALTAHGLGPSDVAELRPGIVYVSENCYGPVGPWAARPGWEQLAQAATGMSYREGLAAADGVPRLAPAAAIHNPGAMIAQLRSMERGKIAHASSPTKASSWRSVRHSMTFGRSTARTGSRSSRRCSSNCGLGVQPVDRLRAVACRSAITSAWAWW
jgi:crotonobetainyl-CoA:carnitine CoA-transferase CaiB-like acyl-CoA transferase